MDERKKLMSLTDISKSFYTNQEVRPATESCAFDIYENEFLIILGPGQCGKTVLLNIMAGLMKPTTGEILFNGQKMTGVNDDVSIVFQKIALLDWLSVLDNVALGLKIKGVPQKEREEIAMRYIRLVGLDGFEKKYPRQLSGGMKQRVGIARAYSTNPQILLMDEPFGQLDAQTRYEMQNEILRIWEREKRTIVFVTNNIEEAVTIGERIILLSKCPASVKKIFESELNYPRDNMSESFLQFRTQIENLTDMAI